MKNRKVKILFTSIIASMFLTVSSCGGDTPSGHAHSWSTSWSSDETYHWHKCTECDAINDKIEHTFVTTVIEPDYDHQGYTHHECSICEYSYNDNYVDPLEHHYSSTWSKDESAHWHACIDEGYETLIKDYALHDFGEWIIDVPATEEHDGTRHHVCNTCSYSHSETYKYVKHIAAERVYLANPSNELFNGYTYSLSPVVVPYDANKNIKYEVEHPELMTVTDNVASATGVGSTLLYVYNDEDNDNVRDDDEAFTVISFTLSNPDADKSVNVQESVTIKVGESKKLSYSATGISALGVEYGFYSEDQSICTIASGVVKGHRPGTTRVSVSLKGYRGYCNVTVENLVDELGTRAYEITADEDFILNKGDSRAISYNILPIGSVDTLKSVESNNEAVVKVNADKTITALKGGTARIKLTTTNDKYTFVLVTVRDNANLSNSYYNNYYGNLTWTNSEDLITKLHAIISAGVTPLRYNTPNWESNQMADQDLYDYSYVDCVYTDTDLLKTKTQSGWQREHAFCASLMTGYSSGDAVTALGRATDFHNLFAAGGGANGSRGNKNLGYARVDSQEIETKENCVYDKKTFEPADEDKGRLARALMYMTVMYNGESAASITESSTKINYNQKPLMLTVDNVDYSKITYSNFTNPKESVKPIVDYYQSLVGTDKSVLDAYVKYMEQSMPYAIGNASDIIEWNSFPVNYVEYQHNNSVYSDYSAAGRGTQGNRNPFVDYPELVEYVFGELKDQPGSLKMLTPTYLALEMDKDEIHHYSVESASLEAFESGTKPAVDDFNIKAIKNNLAEGTLDKSKIIVEDYTFTDDDVENGKVIEIYTDKNTLKVPCKVTSESVITFDTCTWNHIDNNTKDHDKGCYGTFNNENVSTTALFSGLSFTVSCGNTTDPIIIGNSTANGTKIGTGTSAAKKYIPESVTFETNDNVNFDGKTKVNAVYAIASTAANKNYNYEIFIGGTLVKNGTFTGTNIELSVLLPAGQEVTGKVKIVFSNVSAAINIRGLAINAIA